MWGLGALHKFNPTTNKSVVFKWRMVNAQASFHRVSSCLPWSWGFLNYQIAHWHNILKLKKHINTTTKNGLSYKTVDK